MTWRQRSAYAETAAIGYPAAEIQDFIKKHRSVDAKVANEIHVDGKENFVEQLTEAA
jgi:hypothetical protein